MKSFAVVNVKKSLIKEKRFVPIVVMNFIQKTISKNIVMILAVIKGKKKKNKKSTRHHNLKKNFLS